MKDIKLSKVKDASYTPNSVKYYEVLKGNTLLGFISQDVSLSYWEVKDHYSISLSQHTTIKAAFKRAKQLLSKVKRQDLAASWILIPCPDCDGEGYSEEALPGGYFDLRQEAWYPHSKVILCSTCHGSGQLEVCYEAPEGSKAEEAFESHTDANDLTYNYLKDAA